MKICHVKVKKLKMRATAIDLDNPQIQVQLNDVFLKNMRIIHDEGPVAAQEALVQIASVMSKYQDPFVLKCMITFLEITQNSYKPLKKPITFFPLLTKQLNYDNQITHSFIFQATKIFANSIKPELPILGQIIRGCMSSNLEKSISAKRAAMELCKNYDYFCLQIVRELKMPYIIDIIPYLTRSNHVIRSSIQLINDYMVYDYPNLIELIDASIVFVLKIFSFPRSTFFLLMRILSHMKEDEKFVRTILRKLRPAIKYLIPEQMEIMFNFCKEMITHYKYITPYLKIISLMYITDSDIQSIEPNDLRTLVSLIYVLPRTTEWGTKIVEQIQQFKNDLKNPKLFVDVTRALSEYQNVLSYETHTEISNMFYELVMISSDHQDAVGEFLSSVSIDNASSYIELSEVVQIATEKLKIGMARISFVLDQELNKNFIPSDPGLLGVVAFHIGQYQQASHYFSMRRGDGFYDSLKLFTDGELAFLSEDFSNACLLYSQAESSFRISGEMFSLHCILSKIRFLCSSVCLQLSFLKLVPEISDLYMIVDGLQDLIGIALTFPTYSLLLSAEFDKASHECAQRISTLTTEIQALGQQPGVDELYAIVSKFRHVPPAFFKREFPISVTNIRLLNNEVRVPKMGEFMVGVDIDGSIENELHKDAKITLQVSHANLYDYSTPTELPASGRFYVHEGLILFRKPEFDKYEMGIDVWINVQFKHSNSSYIISRTLLKLPIVEIE